MFSVYKKLLALLSHRERRTAIVLFVLLLLVALFETAGVASVMPFIAVLANPAVVEENAYLLRVYEAMGFSSRRAFLLFLGAAFFVVFVCSLLLRALGTWATLKFSYNRNLEWGARLVGGYFRQPYEWFLRRHSAGLAASVLAEVNQVVTGALFPALQALANLLVALFLMILLASVDIVLAVAVGGVLAGGFSLIFMMLRRRLHRIGAERERASHARFHVVSEAFGGIKDVKVYGLEPAFTQRFLEPSKVLADRQIAAGLIAELPSVVIQALLFGGMLVLLLYLMMSYGEFQDAVPIAGLYAFAGYRLLPAVRQIYRDLAQVRFSEAAVDAISRDLANMSNQEEIKEDRQTPIHVKRMIVLDDVHYRYPETDRFALESVSIEIPACTTVAIVGATGSGKTTLVDVILGLLQPSKGTLAVDGEVIRPDRLRSWRCSLGYVPQQIFLADESVAANIAFGLPHDEIDMKSVERAARIANLHHFVISDLPDGYKTHVGERGVRLSGGQRQRIGIARALYHDPDVIILDEATSALDNVTEHAVMEAVQNIGSAKTVILIAHRLSTVKRCDRIFLMEHGRVVAAGTYSDLVVQSERFKRMADLS